MRGSHSAGRLFFICCQAIRDAFSLEITLYDIQNQERPRAMFNQDVSAASAERQHARRQRFCLAQAGSCICAPDA